MNDELRALMNGYLDGVLSEQDQAKLNTAIKDSTDSREEFARLVRLHDGIHNIIVSNPVQADLLQQNDTLLTSPNTWKRFAWVSCLVTTAALVLLGSWASLSPRAIAATELDRLIEKSNDQSDRTYIIYNLDVEPEKGDDRRPPIDGAILHIRQPDQYVLIRKFPGGDQFVTGSDGERSWSIPPVGAVRVSSDPWRFRGPVPGNQHGIPFVNLRSDLVQLRDAYVVTPLKSNTEKMRGLLAIKKSTSHRGPNRVELWYDVHTGMVHRMIFGGLPRARGGPDSVSVELQEKQQLGNNFFQHSTHHSADRRVLEEE